MECFRCDKPIGLNHGHAKYARLILTKGYKIWDRDGKIDRSPKVFHLTCMHSQRRGWEKVGYFKIIRCVKSK